MQPQKTWVEISQRAYEQNLRTIESRLNDGVTLCPVVKANAYGHDLTTIVKLAVELGYTTFAVDSIDEACIVRKYTDGDIFILGYTAPERYNEAIRHRLIQTIYTASSVRELANVANTLQTPVSVNLKVETGTQRQGVAKGDLGQVLATIKEHENVINLESVSSHFSSSEDMQRPEITQNQHAIFSKIISEIEAKGFSPSYRHISCSASTLRFPETHHSMVRIGLTQYGLWPSDLLRRSLLSQVELHPVLSWKARIAQVKDVPSGTPIGYGGAFVSDRPLRIAVIPIGYYDGYTRAFQGKAHMLVRGQKCPVIGIICMNMCMIDVSSVPNVAQGDVVTIVGRDGLNQVTLDMMAEWIDTINYEIPTMIKSHIPRILIPHEKTTL